MCDFTDKVKNSTEFMEFLAYRIAGDSVYVPTSEDLRRIEEIADEKFRAERQGNVSARSPKFDFEKVCRFDGGSVIFSFTVKHGVIEAVAVRGDFFSTAGTGTLTEALTGVPFTAEAVRAAVTGAEFSAYGITAEALALKLCSGI